MSDKRETQFVVDSVLDKYEKTEEGFIRIPARVTRSGVFLYKKLDGTVIREMRPEEEVFSEDSLKSIMGKIVTNEHPSEFVDVTNCKEHQVGFIGDSVEVEDNKYVKVALTITDADTIRDIENGKKELSCGYNAIILKSDNSEEYDTIQTNIRYNHVAIVDRGRAGRKVRIDNEDADLVEDEKKPEKNQEEEIQMENQVEKKDSDTLLFEVQQKEIEKLNKMIADSESKIADLESELEEVNVKFDSFDSLVAEAAKERAELMTVGAELGLEADKLDSLTNDEIKIAYIESKTDSFDIKDSSSESIDFAFSVLKSAKVQKAVKAVKANDSLGSVINDARKESKKSVDEAYTKMIERKKNSWKQGGNK